MAPQVMLAKVAVMGEQVVEDGWFLDAEPILAGKGHHGLHRAPLAFFADPPSFLEPSTRRHATLQDNGRSDRYWSSLQAPKARLARRFSEGSPSSPLVDQSL